MTEEAVDVRSDREGLWRNRHLIWNFARRDLKGRFKGTAVGWLWSLLLPLATVVIYSVVFSVFIRIEPPPFGDGEPGTYWVWLLTGMVTWTFVLNATNSGIPSLLANGSLLQKIYIPSFVPCVASIVAIGVQSLIELGIVAVILLAIGNVGWTWLVVPAWLALLFAFVTSTTYVLSVLNVFYRDVSQLVAVGLQLIFFLTPIIYPLTLIPAEWHGLPLRGLLELSPYTQFVEFGRALLYELRMPGLGPLALTLGWTLAALAMARFVAVRRGQDVSEFI
ncbi:MAG: ABC transporter permease [Actinobacteria bacterium]|nr:MAG: ABC transporter permease [Actinomycetota bacterium]